MDLTINSRLVIPSKELKWRFTKASGPGGQGVNTTDSRVELFFDIKRSPTIHPVQKQRLIENLKNRLINNGLRIVAAEERSQYRNRQIALARLANLLQEGLKLPAKSRRVTKPTQASQIRRLNAKKFRGLLKKKRQQKSSADE